MTTTTTVEGQDRVLATAQHILDSLGTSKDVTDDMLLILSSFDHRLSNISALKSSDLSRLSSSESTVFRHFSSDGPLFDDHDDSCEFLAAVDVLLSLIGSSQSELNRRAENAIHSAMAKLEDELRRIIVSNTIPLDADGLYGCINRAPQTSHAISFVSRDDVDVEVGEGTARDKHFVHERGGSLPGDVSVDLVSAEVVSDIRDIVDRMVRAGYEKECCQVYSSCRRDGLEQCLENLGVERLSIEEVQRIEWRQLDEKMKRWVQALKIVVRVLLTSEKQFCETIFDGEACDVIREVCFVEAAKGCVLQLLNFGEAVAIGKRSPEKLFRILDMYEGLSDTLKYYLRGLFGDECGEFVIDEAKGVLDGLEEAVKGTFVEFEVAVKGESSKKPAQGGEIHPLARYVMNYVTLIVDYGPTLNRLLENDVIPKEVDGDEGDELTPLGKRLMLLLSSLESKLEEKAKLYEDNAMQYVFLMNNKLYVVQKVKDSELGKLLGDDWVKRRRGIIRKYATHYLRASWSKVLGCLRDEGIGSSSSSSSKMTLKERFKNFNACFEEIYRTQTAWKVPDSQLRDELLISISEKVIPAYRAFLGRFGPQLEKGRHSGKYIKYTVEDIDGYLGDLFGGTPCVLHHMRRKSS
ncbi:hypothetical protein RND81_10G200200 [Saponaria officinalis]|uniref:Exocyst subunit Exo70 family protein n=1 Tax=Saponaria officinalis TaxID=3572 RepID=A0AAW1I5W4_SAPOF